MTPRDRGGQEPAPDPSEPRITLIVEPRAVSLYFVTRSELEQLASLGGALHMTFFGISVGPAVAFGIALLTATLDTRTNAAFVAIFAVSALGVAYFAARAYADTRARERVVRSVTGEDRRAA